MATLLGKRKRRAATADTTDGPKNTSGQMEYQEAMRRHFETTFEPLEVQALVQRSLSSHKTNGNHQSSDSDDDGNGSQSDWNGLSDTDEVQIVSYMGAEISQDDHETLKIQQRRFMSSKPPTNVEASVMSSLKTRTSSNADAKNASSLAADDLALQRLLAESHLLSGSTTSTLVPSLKARQTALDLRLQTLGAKNSIQVLGAGNMPMAVRKGIENKKYEKERGRKREAKEAGIVLEREVRSSFDSAKRRKRPKDVGAPAVGKWKGGTLVLGKRDVAEIEGQKLASDFGKQGRGGKKGKKR